jgi:anti-anti-sigma regulatory factor
MRNFCRFDVGFRQSVRLSTMFHAEVDSSQRVLTMSFGDRVDATEMKACLEKVRDMLADIKPGFRLLTDLTSLESMDPDCSTDLGEMMDMCDAKGISAVLTVIPHPKKDIGFALMEPFHYGKHVDVMTYETLADAIQSLAV